MQLRLPPHPHATSAAGEGAAIIIYFEPGTDPNIVNVVNVQNRVNIVLFQLPPLVVRMKGILVSQVVPSIADVREHLTARIRTPTRKTSPTLPTSTSCPGSSGSRGMGKLPRNLGNRIFCDAGLARIPTACAPYNVSSEEVMKALSEQSMIGSPGRLGQATKEEDVAIKEYVLTYIGRAIQQARAVCQHHFKSKSRWGDPAAQRTLARWSWVPSSLIFTRTSTGIPRRPSSLKQAPGSNASEVIESIKAELEKIKRESFPPGMDYEFAYDVSKFLDASIEKVLHTLVEAFILVSLVVYMFLGDLRSTLIPIIAVPVSLIGTFFVLSLMGLSINLITLFAMVLAIGVVVDDAIVVVEAVHAKMAQRHLSPYLATMEVVHEISVRSLPSPS